MILQIHDELIFETKTPKLERAIAMIVGTMESVLRLRVPLRVKVASGMDWSQI